MLGSWAGAELCSKSIGSIVLEENHIHFTLQPELEPQSPDV